MKFHIYRHPQAFMFWPALIYVDVRCSEPTCRAWHGFTVELSFLWWSACLDVTPNHDESQ